MGRLFWKFFFFTMFAQLIATVGIGGAIWLKNATPSTQTEQIDLSPPASFMIESAASTLQYGGLAALRNLLANNDDHRRQIYAVNDQNVDLLGRKVSPEIIANARQQLQSDKSDNPHHVVRQIQASDGQHYLLFSMMFWPDGPGYGQDGPPPPMDNHGGFHDMPPPFAQHGEFGPGGPHPPRDDHFRPFFPLATAVLGSLIFAAMLAWYFSKPINHLRSAFESVASGNMDVGVGSAMGHRRDELTDLGQDFDKMVERLRALLNGQRRLLHDVSHELRSPLARLQVAIGLAKQQPEKLDASLYRIERESTRIDKLVGELLTLSKLEAGVANPVQEDVNMGELITDIVNDARFEAEANNKKLDYTGDCTTIVNGDAELLHRAIENVMRNAIKHTLAGSTVTLDASIDKLRKELRLSILDCGPGVPEAELKNIFEPFFRSASTLQNTDGHGLGLAIAQRVVTTFGGSIHATNRKDGGLCVDIILPVK